MNRKLKYTFLIIILFNILYFHAQLNVLDSLLKLLPDDLYPLTQLAHQYRFQLYYTRINNLENNQIRFIEYAYPNAETLYVYPASMVKLPVSIAAVKKIETIHQPEINWYSKILMDSLFCQKALINDSIGFPKYPHLNKWIQRMLIISDNNAYTHTYDFLNCRTLHEWLKDWHFEQAKIQNKFISKCMNDSTLYTPDIYILNCADDTIFIQKGDSLCRFIDTNEKKYTVGYTIKKEKNGKKIIRHRVPKSFSNHNDWSLKYSHQLMKYLIFDEELKILNLSSEHKDSIIKYMGSYPREYSSLQVDTNIYYDTWKKFFIYGGKYKRINEDTLRSINIIGRAYGFLSETAYIIDFKNKIHFILSAAIYINPNDIMDGRYNYEKAYQLFYHISRLIYLYEKKQDKNSTYQLYKYEKLFHHQQN